MKGNDPMRESVEAQTLLYAVQRAMFCQRCDAVLDVRRAVLLFERERRTRILCSRCWDGMPEVDGEGEVTDGRDFAW